MPKVNARCGWLEVVGLFVLASAAAFLIATSWRKWSDPLIDFGAQLYTAWRLSQGAVLYRDVGLLYGPLSQYFNAAIFRIFGTGLIVLAIANLVIFAAISSSIYVIFRKGWGALAAWLSTLIFISVFGFSLFVDAGNYNYATPYAHETTHGILICLLLCLALTSWVEKPSATRVFISGLLLGLTVLLKPEFILAALTITSLAVLAHWKSRGFPKARAILTWTAGAVLPTTLFSVYFLQFLPWDQAISASSRAWLYTLDSSLTADYFQVRRLGLDQPWTQVLTQTFATILALAVIALLAAIVFLLQWKPRMWLVILSGAILVALFGWLACFVINWIESGSCLFGLTIIYLLVSIGFFIRRLNATDAEFHVRVLRLLVAGLAVALMSRMFLNARIYHYGYYQAALAALIVPAVMIAELPAWFRAGSRGRLIAAVGTLIIVMPGVANLVMRSQHRYVSRTFAVATGRDRFYCLPPQIDPLGEIINSIADALHEKGQDKTLTVLPEGESINYLARLRNPVPHAFFYAGATSGGREREVVNDMSRIPPYWIVIISRDLGGFGIERYGEKPGSGAEILRWVEQNYKQVASIGGDPLDYRERGAIILREYSR